ncbi:RteC domain-containing protein [Niabella sp. CJ426]|uniref:RteC domain-containing protein n=1 Tax=Niabella sp. CJ426 TaxID=3393740 RepID=UPI003D0806EB
MKDNTIYQLLDLRGELESKLSAVDLSDKVIQRSNVAFYTAQEYLVRLKELQPASFGSEADEIEYYKTISPLFHAYLIFFHRVFQLEASAFPSERLRTKQYKKEQKVIRLYVEQNLQAYRYFITGDESFDREFFLSNPTPPPTNIEETELLSDLQHITPMTLKFARFIAYEKLNEYLDRRLHRAESSGVLPDGITAEWTDKKIYLHQLTYALVYSKSINHGNITVKALSRIFEIIFNTDLSNVHRSRQEMYSQKDDAAYLNLLISRYHAGMREADERHNKR